jgi:hypothetical protein
MRRILVEHARRRARVIQSVVWSPDGSRLAFAVRASRVDSFVIEDALALPDVADAIASR